MNDGGTPRLMTARMIRQNRDRGMQRDHGVQGAAIVQRRRRRRFALIALGVLIWVSAWALRDLVGLATDWLQSHILIIGGLTVIVTAFVIAHRRDATRAEFSRSWLAALPIRVRAARWERLRIEMFSAAMAVVAFTFAIVVAASVLIFDPKREGLLTPLWAFFCGAVVLGAIASFAIPAPKHSDLPPGSRYVPKQQLKKGRPLVPSLAALGQWPVRQMFAQARPKRVARATVPVLLSMTIGAKADTAIVALGMLAATSALALLVPAAISISVAVRGWMAPLPLAPPTILRALLARSLIVMLGASALDGFLAGVLGASYRAAAMAALWIAAVSAAAMFSGVWLQGMRATNHRRRTNLA